MMPSLSLKTYAYIALAIAGMAFAWWGINWLTEITQKAAAFETAQIELATEKSNLVQLKGEYDEQKSKAENFRLEQEKQRRIAAERNRKLQALLGAYRDTGDIDPLNVRLRIALESIQGYRYDDSEGTLAPATPRDGAVCLSLSGIEALITDFERVADAMVVIYGE